MAQPRIDWAALSQPELETVLKDARGEGARRIRALMSLMGMSGEGKRGRKPSDPFAAAIAELTGEESPETEDDAAADYSPSSATT